MKLRSRARRVAVIIKREDCSLQTNASNEARGLIPDATLSVKQDSENCTTLVKQEEPFASALVIINVQVEPSEEMNKAIKQAAKLTSSTHLELYNIKDYHYRCRLCL